VKINLVVARITGLNLHRDIMVFLGAKDPLTMQLLILAIQFVSLDFSTYCINHDVSGI
jgi:hypothetical protein